MSTRRYSHSAPAAMAQAFAFSPTSCAFALAVAASLLAGPALADTPTPQDKIGELVKMYLPGTATHRPQVDSHEAIRLTGACVDGNIVFRAKNGAKSWTGRGYVQVTDARSGEVLHERFLRMGAGQSASFRVYQNAEQSMHYSMKVTLPLNSVTYVRGFRGRCAAPDLDVVNARR
ncbi:hypothetical protein V5T82_04690 [Magnetovibrio sp. PR-2]|uniref:hypothetical protein n=1 Tax=Magnetovibrio sp. PR-2 TaxID=3120356 RepID=UPI002FCDF772